MRKKNNNKQVSSNQQKNKNRYRRPGENVSFYHTLKVMFISGVISSFSPAAHSAPNDNILSDNRTYANLSQLSYDKNLKEGDTVFLDGQTATITKVEQDDVGFGAIAVQFNNKTVIAFRGTDSKSDFLDDIGLVFNNNTGSGNFFGRSISRQYNSALKFVNEFTSEFPDENIEFTGHSLGGSIAQYAGVVYDHRTVTYNAAPISKLSFSFYNLSDAEILIRSRDILNIRQDGDPISSYLGGDSLSVGRDVIVDTGLCVAPIQQGCLHSIDKLVLQSDFIYYSDPEFLEGIKTTFDEFSAQVDLLREEREREWQEQYGYNEDQKIIWVEGLDPNEAPIIIVDPGEPIDPVGPTDPVDTPTPTDPVDTPVVGSGDHGYLAGRSVENGRVFLGNTLATGAEIILQQEPVQFAAVTDIANISSQTVLQSTTLLGNYEYVSWGSWTGELNGTLSSGLPFSAESFWISGQETPDTDLPSFGRATYNGNILGFGARSDGSSARIPLNGDFSMIVDFGANDLEYDFSLKKEDGTIVFQSDLLWADGGISSGQNSYSFNSQFHANHSLNNQYFWHDFYLGGSFYGPNAEHVGGSWVLTGITDSEINEATGIYWGNRREVSNQIPSYFRTYVNANNSFGVSSSWADLDYSVAEGSNNNIDSYSSSDQLEIQEYPPVGFSRDVAVVKISSRNDDGQYAYTSWGTWESLDNQDGPHWGNEGFWVTGAPTRGHIIENRTGSAQYSGDINGGFVSTSGAVQSSGGNVNIGVNFDTSSVSGNFQFERADGVKSSVATFDESLDVGVYETNFGTFASGSISQASGSGIQGTFFGPNAEEIGGNVWMVEEEGAYGGIFRANQ